MARTLLLRCPILFAFAACTLPPLPERTTPRAAPPAADVAIAPASEPAPPSEPAAGASPVPVIALVPAAPGAEGARQATPVPAPLPPVVFAIVADGEARTVEVEVGQELVFENLDTICHSLFSSSAEHRFDVGVLRPADRASVRFARPGTVQVHCALHEHRQLTIRVVAATRGGPWAPR